MNIRNLSNAFKNISFDLPTSASGSAQQTPANSNDSAARSSSTAASVDTLSDWNSDPSRGPLASDVGSPSAPPQPVESAALLGRVFLWAAKVARDAIAVDLASRGAQSIGDAAGRAFSRVGNEMARMKSAMTGR